MQAKYILATNVTLDTCSSVIARSFSAGHKPQTLWSVIRVALAYESDGTSIRDQSGSGWVCPI